jgi:hypothetical protein
VALSNADISLTAECDNGDVLIGKEFSISDGPDKEFGKISAIPDPLTQSYTLLAQVDEPAEFISYALCLDITP